MENLRFVNSSTRHLYIVMSSSFDSQGNQYNAQIIGKDVLYIETIQHCKPCQLKRNTRETLFRVVSIVALSVLLIETNFTFFSSILYSSSFQLFPLTNQAAQSRTQLFYSLFSFFTFCTFVIIFFFSCLTIVDIYLNI